jgi:hypothetical protein
MPEPIRLIVGTPGFLPQEVGALADLPFEPHLLFGFRLKGIATGHQWPPSADMGPRSQLRYGRGEIQLLRWFQPPSEAGDNRCFDACVLRPPHHALANEFINDARDVFFA